ncbi:hypothetical protein VN12_25055 [Pirellula sp. SH-Sr6A]|nr:hypothetical protein [Pirellula sp. SH-Sr6A]AMV35383.1 hypothetical protein VN12_25055 [Pirellula sp. SH-Sr6A]
MAHYLFDHERLNVYRPTIVYVADAFDALCSLKGLHRHARDPRLRVAQ